MSKREGETERPTKAMLTERHRSTCERTDKKLNAKRSALLCDAEMQGGKAATKTRTSGHDPLLALQSRGPGADPFWATGNGEEDGRTMELRLTREMTRMAQKRENGLEMDFPPFLSHFSLISLIFEAKVLFWISLPHFGAKGPIWICNRSTGLQR